MLSSASVPRPPRVSVLCRACRPLWAAVWVAVALAGDAGRDLARWRPRRGDGSTARRALLNRPSALRTVDPGHWYRPATEAPGVPLTRRRRRHSSRRLDATTGVRLGPAAPCASSAWRSKSRCSPARGTRHRRRSASGPPHDRGFRRALDRRRGRRGGAPGSMRGDGVGDAAPGRRGDMTPSPRARR